MSRSLEVSASFHFLALCSSSEVRLRFNLLVGLSSFPYSTAGHGMWCWGADFAPQRHIRMLVLAPTLAQHRIVHRTASHDPHKVCEWRPRSPRGLEFHSRLVRKKRTKPSRAPPELLPDMCRPGRIQIGSDGTICLLPTRVSGKAVKSRSALSCNGALQS